MAAPSIGQIRRQAVTAGRLIDQAVEAHDELLRMIDALDDAETRKAEDIARIRSQRFPSLSERRALREAGAS